MGGLLENGLSHHYLGENHLGMSDLGEFMTLGGCHKRGLSCSDDLEAAVHLTS